MKITENFKQYISGFFDGDGSITVEKIKGGYTLRIKFSQSNENWIDTIHQYYPFLKKSEYKRNKNSRKEYELRASGIQIKPLIQDLLKYSILKYKQLIEANKFFELINTRNKNKEKEIIYLKLKELKNNNNNNKPYERLSLFYISGLFDAEGSIGIYNKTLRVKLTQKSDTIILQKIANIYKNLNNINNYAISFYGKNSLKFLNDIKKYCIYKTPQILVALKYIDTINVKLTNEILNLRKEYVKILKHEKHV